MGTALSKLGLVHNRCAADPVTYGLVIPVYLMLLVYINLATYVAPSIQAYCMTTRAGSLLTAVVYFINVTAI